MKCLATPHVIRRQKGVAAIEFAIILPLLLLILIGMVVYGQLMWNYDALSKATRDAARFLSTESDINAAMSTARSMVDNAAKAAGINIPDPANDVTINCSGGCSTPGNVTVRVDYDMVVGWGPILPPPQPLSGPTFTLHLTPHTTMPYMP